MNQIVSWALLALTLTVAAPAFAAQDYNPAALPHDRASLQRLNDLQLGVLRTAVRHCGAFYRSRHSMNFCVTSNTDLDVRKSPNEALKAFHFGLPYFTRYDEYRSMVDVLRVYHPEN